LNHPDFKGRVSKANCRNFVDNRASVQDGNGHGTHCCGVIAGPAQPRCGMRYGVAPKVTLMVGKVLDDSGDGKDSDIIEGIAWAVSRGANVISLSLGSKRKLDAPFSPAYAALARRLLKAPLNCIIVAATGNASARPHYRMPVVNPAACPWIVSVAAVGADARIAPFSCAQMDKIGNVNLSAPGAGVLSSYAAGKYAFMNGTSMAAAHIAGITALYHEVIPGNSALRLWPFLTRNVIPLGASSDFGYGLSQAP
jgi:subtilisin family serine protease